MDIFNPTDVFVRKNHLKINIFIPTDVFDRIFFFVFKGECLFFSFFYYFLTIYTNISGCKFQRLKFLTVTVAKKKMF